MARTVSLGTMVKQICSLSGTKDVNDWEDGFITGLDVTTNSGDKTTMLSPKQIEVVERLWQKHFA